MADERGSIVYSNLALANAAALVVSGAAGLTGYHLFNPGAAFTYVRLYDAGNAANVTVGTTVPKMSLGLPANGGATRAFSKPVRFTNGIVASCANTANGAGAPAANNVVEIDYTR